MASLLFLPLSLSLSCKPNNNLSIRPNNTKGPHLSLSPRKAKLPLKTPLKFSAQDQQDQNQTSSSSSVAVAADDGKLGNEEEKGREEKEEEEAQKQQEADWKTDEEFKKFMGNPSIEAAIKLEKKRADRKLRELDSEVDSNPIVGFFKKRVRDSLQREKERLEKVEEIFKALDLNKLKRCFGFDTFFAMDVQRFGDRGIFIGNLRRPIEEVMPKLEKKLFEATRRPVVLWFMDEKTDDITKPGFGDEERKGDRSPTFFREMEWLKDFVATSAAGAKPVNASGPSTPPNGSLFSF